MKGNIPPIGVCAWVLKSARLADKVKWVIKNNFTGVSLLQSVMDIDAKDRKDTAEAITSAKLNVTYHGNVHHKLTSAGELDLEFVKQLIDDVLWWNENTNGVFSCCFDPIKTPKDQKSIFNIKINKEYMRLLSSGLKSAGVRIGIENVFAEATKFCTAEDFSIFKEACKGMDIGMLFDAGHANIHVRSDSEENEKEIGSYYNTIPLEALEIHFSDNFGKKDEHKELGYGNLDLKALLSAVKKKGFIGQFSIEVCKDIVSGKYDFDITDPKETDFILKSKDRLLDTWDSLK